MSLNGSISQAWHVHNFLLSMDYVEPLRKFTARLPRNGSVEKATFIHSVTEECHFDFCMGGKGFNIS